MDAEAGAGVLVFEAIGQARHHFRSSVFRPFARHLSVWRGRWSARSQSRSLRPTGPFPARLHQEQVVTSMDGKGRAFDVVSIERLWRTVKYEIS